MKKLTALLLLLSALASADEGNVRLGKYSGVVEAAHPNSGFAKRYVGSRLEFDADNGLLELALTLEVDGKTTWIPPQTICSSLIVEAYPSTENNLHAVQYDKKTKSDFRPFVAWLMIETTDDEFRSYFKFFSSGIEGLVTGTCTHL